MDIKTSYMGLSLDSPIVVSACPLSNDLDNIKRMQDAGAGAVVLFSLFEEQIRQQEQRMESIRHLTGGVFAEASSYFPDLDSFEAGPFEYLEKIRQAKLQTSIPVIASLNGITNEGWIKYAGQIEEAGADALEINIFFIPADIATSSVHVEQRYIDIVKAVASSVRIPVSVKLNPYFSAMGNIARRVADSGAKGLTLFNRFYQPDFDIHQLRVLPNLQFSHTSEIRLPLLWLAILFGRLPISLAATSGVQSEVEVIKYLLAGADVAMVASTLYKHGIDYIAVMNEGIRSWMLQMGFNSIQAFKGSMSQMNISDPTAYERANYIKIVSNS